MQAPSVVESCHFHVDLAYVTPLQGLQCGSPYSFWNRNFQEPAVSRQAPHKSLLSWSFISCPLFAWSCWCFSVCLFVFSWSPGCSFFTVGSGNLATSTLLEQSLPGHCWVPKEKSCGKCQVSSRVYLPGLNIPFGWVKAKPLSPAWMFRDLLLALFIDFLKPKKC